VHSGTFVCFIILFKGELSWVNVVVVVAAVKAAVTVVEKQAAVIQGEVKVPVETKEAVAAILTIQVLQEIRQVVAEEMYQNN